MDKLVVSNIAWTNEEEQEIAQRLKKLGITKVEIAPTKIWQDPTKATDKEIGDYLKFWESYGIEVVAFQSMLFGRMDMKLFADETTRQKTQRFLEGFIVLAGKMGAKAMVFGSPKNRQRGDLPIEEADKIAESFFNKLGDVSQANNTHFCLEPNPVEYDCDYITDASKGIDMVRKVNNLGFGLHLDTAGMTLAGDPIRKSIEDSALFLRHFHASSPYLGLVEPGDVRHEEAGVALKNIGYKGFISIEMRPDEVGKNEERIEHAVKYIKTAYRPYLG